MLFALGHGWKSRTHAANIKFQPTACSAGFKQYFSFYFCLEGRIYKISLLNPLPVLTILLNPLPIPVAFKILREILELSFTSSFMISTRELVKCLEILSVYCSSLVLYTNVSGSKRGPINIMRTLICFGS